MRPARYLIPHLPGPDDRGLETPALVSEVFNAGGIGMLAGSCVAPDRPRKDIRAGEARVGEESVFRGRRGFNSHTDGPRGPELSFWGTELRVLLA